MNLLDFTRTTLTNCTRQRTFENNTIYNINKPIYREYRYGYHDKTNYEFELSLQDDNLIVLKKKDNIIISKWEYPYATDLRTYDMDPTEFYSNSEEPLEDLLEMGFHVGLARGIFGTIFIFGKKCLVFYNIIPAFFEFEFELDENYTTNIFNTIVTNESIYNPFIIEYINAYLPDPYEEIPSIYDDLDTALNTLNIELPKGIRYFENGDQIAFDVIVHK